MAHRRLNGLVVGIWIANIVICLAAGGLYAWYGGSLPAALANNHPGDAALFLATPSQTLTPRPSVTPVPAPTQRPTITPWPTPSIGPSLTAMVSLPGNAQVIGYSVQRRPLEVFRYGSGPQHKLIVAGIHGGYEANTIELADQLIAYLNDHPDRVPPDTTLYILHDLNPDGLAHGRTPDGRERQQRRP